MTFPNSPIRCLFSAYALPAVLPCGAEPILDGASLSHTAATSWEAWKNEMQAILGAFASQGCKSVFCRLPKHYVDVDPNPYSVEQVLTRKAKGDSLLLAQSFRFLSEECALRDWTLILRADCAAENALALLERAERTVGLPPMIWMTATAATRDRLLEFTAKPHKNFMRCGISLAEYPSDAELGIALSAYAARYPFRRLAIFSGGDLRYMGYGYDRFQRCIAKQSGDRS